MSEKKEKKPPIGGIGQFSKFGGAKKGEQTHSQIADTGDFQITTNQDSQIADNQDSNVDRNLKSQLLGAPDSQLSGKQDKRMVSYLKEKKPERKAQIAYLPPALIKRLKQYALDHDMEISEVVAQGIEMLLDSQER